MTEPDSPGKGTRNLNAEKIIHGFKKYIILSHNYRAWFATPGHDLHFVIISIIILLENLNSFSVIRICFASGPHCVISEPSVSS